MARLTDIRGRIAGAPVVAAGAAQTFFVSRAGPDNAVAQRIGEILEKEGHKAILQDWDIKNKSFMAEMHRALTCGARTIALLSPDYLVGRDHCEAEWQSTIADDPLNRQAKLIVLRIRDCAPTGLLKPIAYTDVTRLLAPSDANLLREVVLAAVDPNVARRLSQNLAGYFKTARTLVHPAIHATPNFTGRDTELQKIAQSLAAGAQAAITQPAAVHGLGGVGKSTLARQYAWQVAQGDDYAGIWWMDAERSSPEGVDQKSWDGIERGLMELRSTLYPGTAEPQDRNAAAREMMAHLSGLSAGKLWLLIYDNADDVQVTAQDYWAPPEHVRVLMTSRLAKWPAGVTGVEVDEWAIDEAIAYLKKESQRGDLSDADARVIAEELGRLPLALSHAAAYLREVDTATPESYLAALKSHLKNVPETADKKTRAVFTTLIENVAQAETRAKGATAVMRLAAFFAPDNIPEELFQQEPDETYPVDLRAVFGDPLALEQALGALARLSLLDYARDTKTFSVHRLVQQTLRDELGDREQTWAAAAVSACNAAWPESGDFKHWPAIERLLPHARCAADLAADECGVLLGFVLNEAAVHLYTRGAYGLAEPLAQRAIHIREKTLGPDHPDVGASLNNLAVLYDALEKYDLAEPVFERSLLIFEKVLGPDNPDFGRVLDNLAGLYGQQTKYELAERLTKRALLVLEKELGPDHPDFGTSLNNLAGLFVCQGKYDLAEPLYKRSIPIFENALGPNHPSVATSLNNLALLCVQLGRMDEAVVSARRAHAIVLLALGTDHPNTQLAAQTLAGIEGEIAEGKG